MKKDVNKVFNDLDTLRAFCVEYGYRFNEADLYKQSGPWSILMRQRHQGLVPYNNWERDNRPGRFHKSNRDRARA